MRYNFNTDLPLMIKGYSSKLLEDFFKYIISKGYVKSKTNSRIKIASVAGSVFINNCYLSSNVNKRTVTLTLDKNSYNRAYIKNGSEGKVKVSYQYTKWFMEFLVETKRGSVEIGGLEYATFVGGGQYMYKIIDKHTSVFTMENRFYEDMCNLSSSINFDPIDNVIILRDVNGKDTTMKLDVYRKGMKNSLIDYNERGVGISVVDPLTGMDYMLQLQKIYNVDFNHGGRIYDMGIQILPKKVRRRLVIGGKETCIYDYKAFETSLIYTIQGEDLDTDPYQLHIKEYDNKILREIGKMIMTRIYYCKNRKELQFTVNRDIEDSFNLERLVKEGKIPEKRIPVGYMIEMLENRHECIMEHFYRKGQDPSNLGSLVMDYVVDYMLQNHKCLVVPVFDEVIVDRDYEFEVLRVMKEAFVRVVGSSANCSIVKEK